jgi:hypothetical protein
LTAAQEGCTLMLTSLGHRVLLVLMRSRSFWLFAATGFAELIALLLIGESTMSVKAVAVICLLVVWVGRGSRVAWWLFVAANSFVLLTTWALMLGSGAGTGGPGGGTDWGNVIVLSVGSAALLVILLSPAMRRRPLLSA